jgi:hypothetical protein
VVGVFVLLIRVPALIVAALGLVVVAAGRWYVTPRHRMRRQAPAVRTWRPTFCAAWTPGLAVATPADCPRRAPTLCLGCATVPDRRVLGKFPSHANGNSQ